MGSLFFLLLLGSVDAVGAMNETSIIEDIRLKLTL
jgi:hypothetical protein